MSPKSERPMAARGSRARRPGGARRSSPGGESLPLRHRHCRIQSPSRRGDGKERGGKRGNEEILPGIRRISRVRSCGNVVQEEGAGSGYAAETGRGTRPGRRAARHDGGGGREGFFVLRSPPTNQNPPQKEKKKNKRNVGGGEKKPPPPGEALSG